jgi:hypothetical protein
MFGIRTDRVDVVWEITGRGKSQSLWISRTQSGRKP